MTFSAAVRILLRRWLPIALVTLLVGAATYAVSSTRTPTYTATTTEYFTVNVGGTAAELAQSSNYISNQMASFGELAVSPAVLNPVIDQLQLSMTVKELGRALEVTTPRNTVILQISASDSNPARAAAIANAVGSELVNAVDTVGPKLTNGRSLVAVQPIQTALPPTIQSAPNTRRNTALGLLIGLLLASAVVLALHRADRRVRDSHGVAQLTDKPVVGTIRRARELDRHGLAVVAAPASRAAEDVRQLRAAVEQVAGGRSLVVAISSSVRGEGRSTVAANLAAALGESGHPTVLVDADLRQPRLAEITGTAADHGLLAALSDPARTAEAVQGVPSAHVDVLTAGGTHPNPSAVLTSAALGAVVAELRRRYAFVVVDTPAVLAATDVAALRGVADGVVMVARSSKVRGEELESALRDVELAGLETLGVTLNGVREQDLTTSSAVYGSSGSGRAQQGARADRAARRETTPNWGSSAD